MKILMTNLGLVNSHGSEIWTWTIAEYLIRKGHEITILTNEIGEFAKVYLKDCEVIDKVPKNKFHFGIFGHGRSIRDFSDIRVDSAVLICHGRFDNEKPVIRCHYPHIHVSVSYEVRKHWLINLGIDSVVVLNPVRPEWFRSKSPDKKLSRVVCANHRYHAPEVMIDAFENRNVDFLRLKDGFTQKEMIDIYDACELIIGTGRYIYEGMAACRNVIIADSKHCLGYVTRNNYANYVWYNMTARNPKAKAPNWDALIDEHENHHPSFMQNIASKHHHVNKIAGNLLRLLWSK